MKKKFLLITLLFITLKLIGQPGSGTSLAFDANSHIIVNNGTGIQPGLNMTIECWSRSNTSTWSDYGVMVNKPGAFILHPDLGSKIVRFYITNNYSIRFNPDPSFDITEWHHYAGTYNGTTGDLRMYVDGNLVAQGTLTGAGIVPNVGDLYLGHDPCCGGRYLNGGIDEVRLWNVERSVCEIRQAMNTALYGNESGLLAYYNFNDPDVTAGGNNSGQTILTDLGLSNGSQDGSLINFALNGTTSNWVNGYTGRMLNWFRDVDGDTYGALQAISSFTQPANTVCVTGDCNDNNVNVNPGAIEICDNGIDDDCDGFIDETLPAGAIIFLPFNGNANDATANGHNGIVHNATLTSDRFGNTNSAYYFNGTDARIEIPDHPDFHVTDFSIGGWFNITTNPTQQYQCFFGKSFGNSYFNSYGIGYDNYSSLIGGAWSDGNSSPIYFVPFPLNNQWFHYVITYNDASNEIKYYINGNLFASTTTPLSIATDDKPILIGTEYENGILQYFAKGSMDELVIYNKTLSPSEVILLSKSSQNLRTFYRDNDGDGYGNPGVSQIACTPPAGYVSNNTDCNDNNINTHRGATEVCDGVDNNCNGQTDEGLIPVASASSSPYVLCNGSNVHLYASQAPAYLWTGPDGFTSSEQNPVIVNAGTANTGTYTLTVSNGPGCSANDVVFVKVNPTPNVEITGACATENLTLNSSLPVNSINWMLNSSTVYNSTASANGTTVAGGNGAGSGPNQLNGPVFLFVDGTGNIYVAERENSRVMKWSSGSTSGEQVGGFGQINVAIQPFVDHDTVYVSDNSHHRVLKYLPGSVTGIVVAGGNGQGGENNQLNNPNGIWLDHHRNLFIADYSNNRVVKWPIGAGNGTVVATSLNGPVSVYVDDADNLYVGDQNNNKVIKYASGSLTGIIVAGGNGAGSSANQFNSIGQIFVDAYNNIYVVDIGNHRVQKWKPGSTSGITVAGGNGSGGAENQFNAPQGIFFDSYGNMYVSDYINSRVQKISYTPPSLVYGPAQTGNYTALVTAVNSCEAISNTFTVLEQTRYYLDNDHDGYGEINDQGLLSCNPVEGRVANNKDCDDTKISVHPGAIEVCNGIDDNCDGQIDEGVKTTFYKDNDGDGYGSVTITTQACTAPSGYVSNNTDCNDNNASIHPEAIEICNGIDDNCDGQIDEGGTGTTPIITASGPVIFCAGGSVILTSSAGSSYVWSTGAATQSITVTQTGNYTVTIAGGGGCAATSLPIAVTVNSLPTIFSLTGTGAYCVGSAGASIGISGSQTGVNYQLKRNGTNASSPVPGTGNAINFDNQTAAGIYTVRAINPLTNCSSEMSGTISVVAYSISQFFSVTGGGCPLTSIGLSGSQVGVTYQLQLNGNKMGDPKTGTGYSLNFGSQTAQGIYTVVAVHVITGCSSPMYGSATIYPSSTAYNVTGGGSYCNGGSGVAIGLSGSENGSWYNLYRNGNGNVVASRSGTGSALSFGNQTVGGTYSIVAHGNYCPSTMNGTAVITVNPLPAQFSVTGGGNYCAGGNGVPVGLSGSELNVNYQLKRLVNGDAYIDIGGIISGTGLALSFSNQTTGSYKVVASNAITGCSRSMLNNAYIGITSPPSANINTFGSTTFCDGGSVKLYVPYSFGNSYLWSNGATTYSIDATQSGSYTVKVTNQSGCSTTSLPVNVTVIPTSNAYTVTGGGSYCIGTPDIAVGLSGSQVGFTYQLRKVLSFYGYSSIVTLPGTGDILNFGYQPEGTYVVVATNATTNNCTVQMSGSAIITLTYNYTYNISGGGCIGSRIGLNGSQSGVKYQLKLNGTPVGNIVSGTGSPISFGNQTLTGTYTVVATNTATGCINTMFGSASIISPAVFSVTGGGSYCSGGSGVVIGLSGSENDSWYILYRNGMDVVAKLGTGSAINFGNQTVAGTYSVIANRFPPAGYYCSLVMNGNASVIINELPLQYSVAGGGSYCSGGTGIAIGLSGSQSGINYQLERNGVNIGNPVQGTGNAIPFGYQTVAGSYTVTAANAITGCSSNMTGSKTVSINPIITSITIPAVYTVNPGGAANTIYIGYGNSSLTLNALVSGGTTPFTYRWTAGSANGTVLSTSSSVTVSPSATTTYYLNVKDANNCSISTINKTVFVKDIRCGTPLNKVTVCNPANNTESCVSTAQVKTFLQSGYYLGRCNVSETTSSQNERTDSKLSEEPDLINDATLFPNQQVTIYPNPANQQVNVKLGNELIKGKVTVRIIDRNGSIVKRSEYTNTLKSQQIMLNTSSLPGGLYLISITDSKGSKVQHKVVIAH